MIITIEGMPASGKTALAEHLVRHHNGVRIGELNQAFLRPDPESVVWHLQRQVDRWARAMRSDRPDRLIVLDGDPYRAIWSGWIYPERAELPWQEALGFFEDRVTAIGLPRFYLYLLASAEERLQEEIERARALGQDQARAMDRHRSHALMSGSQAAFFVALGDAFPDFVLPCEAGTLSATAETILGHFPPEPMDRQVVLEFMRDWLQSNSPAALQPSTLTEA